MVFIKAPNFHNSHLINLPPASVSHSTPALNMNSPELPTILHTTHAGSARVLLSGPQPRHHSVSCVHWQAFHMSSPPTAPHCSLSFNLEFHCNRISWTLYVSFSCAADVLDWHKAKEKERQGSRRCRLANKSTASYQFTFMCFFFSLHVNPRLFTSTPLHPQGDGWLLLPWLMPKGNRANGPAVLRGLWPEAICPHWFCPCLNGMFLWWALSELVSMSYPPPWSKLPPKPGTREALLVLTSGNIQILLLPYYEILGIPMKFLLHIFDRTLNSKATEIESWRQFQPFFT